MKEGVKGIVDVGQKIKVWLTEIDKLENQVNRAEQAIKEHEGKIKEAQQKIIELQGKVKFGKELLGQPIPESSAVAPLVRRRMASTVQTLPKAITEVVDSQPDKSFTVPEIADALLKNNFKSESTNFKVLVSITLNKMAKKRRIELMRDGRFVKYRALKASEEETPKLIK